MLIENIRKHLNHCAKMELDERKTSQRGLLPQKHEYPLRVGIVERDSQKKTNNQIDKNPLHIFVDERNLERNKMMDKLDNNKNFLPENEE